MLIILRRILAVVVLSCCTFLVQSQITQHLWVGQSYTCDAGSIMMGLVSDVSWTSNGGYISLSGSGFYRNATITQYFYGTGSVTCSWKYRLNYDDRPQSMSKTWYFECNDNQASITPTTMKMSVGDVEYLGYSHQYNNSYEIYADAYFSSRNPSVATVSESGLVTAVGPGTTYITLYSKISSTSPYCIVTVEEVDPISVSIPSSLTAYVGESQSISATLYPSGAKSTLTWFSTDISIASVSSGCVTGNEEGTTTIYATTSNELRSNDCTVTVKYRVPIGISLSSSTLYLPIGESRKLNYTVTPSNAKTTVSWASDNTAVATVDDDGNVTAIKAGKAVIKVQTDNGCWATCEVTVPERYYYLVVWLQEDGFVVYPLIENPVVVYDDGYLVVRTDTKTVEFVSEEVKNFTISNGIPSEPSASICDITPNDGIMYLGGDYASFVGCRAYMDVGVYAVNGMLVKTGRTDADGNLYLSLQELEKGIYIIKSEKITCKILKQ